MKPFAVEPLAGSKVKELSKIRSRIDLAPPYQRQAEIWSSNKRQLFIDSLLNGFDVPKLYFHNVQGKNKKSYQYAVVDGKQRLETIWSFLDDGFALSEEFEYFEKPSAGGAGQMYSELSPSMQATLDSYKLPIEVIFTDDPQWVEELFCRLNEAVALNAPERRNAMGGPLPPIIRELPSRKFFSDRLPFANGRYKHLDLATKFLYLEHVDGPAETKKRTLDKFVKDFRESDDTSAAKKLKTKTDAVLGRLEDVFGKSDNLLNSLGLVVIYYLLERDKELSSIPDCRDALSYFDELRRQVRALMRAEATSNSNLGLDSELVEFERLSQSPNDIAAMKMRMKLLLRYAKDTKLIKSKLRELK